MALKDGSFLKGAFFGFTFICVIIWFLHRFGFLHVYSDPTTLENFSIFERELSTQRQTVDESIKGLEIIKAELEKAISNDQKPYTIDQTKGFQSLKTAWPQVFEKVSHLAPPDGAYIFRVLDDQYKVLVLSQLCSLVSIQHPSYVDSPRKKYGFICQHYGVWSAKGDRL